MKEFTKNRAALLRLFFTNPDQSFYMQEIGRILGKKPGNFQRAINNMEEEGILVSERKANARYFSANKEYSLYDEMKNIVFKTIGITGSIKDALKTIGNIDYAFIYGSYAKGKENYLSDIDLILIGSCDEDEAVKNFDRLEDMIKRDINYKLYTPVELKKSVRQKEPFLLNILEDKKIMLIGEEDALRKIFKR
jgi:predicted nucleotidyltransferase